MYRKHKFDMVIMKGFLWRLNVNSMLNMFVKYTIFNSLYVIYKYMLICYMIAREWFLDNT